MSAQHTPGPWKAVDRLLPKGGTKHEIWQDKTGQRMGEYRIAEVEFPNDASLIAAAPEMAAEITRLRAEREELVAALRPFAEAEQLARNQFLPGASSLAIRMRVACHWIEWPHLTKARALLAKLEGK